MYHYIVVFLVIIASLFMSCVEEDKEVFIDSPILRLCITDSLKKDAEDKIYESDVSEIKELECRKEGIYNVHGIKNLKKLESLYIVGSYANEDFDEIGELKNLKKLVLLQYRKSHEFLSNIQSLEALSLFPTHTDSLSMLENLNLKALEIKDIDNNISYEMLNSIGKIASLEKLFLQENNISDLNFLNDLINLKFLKIDYNKLEDLSPLKNLVNLEELNLIANYEIKDLSPIKNLTKLKALALAGLKITDLSALEKLTNLERLHVYYNEELTDISGIRNSIKLKEIRLDENNITDISALQGMVDLEYLDFNYNNVVDISALEDLVSLTDLKLYSNKVLDLTPLKGLLNLRVLNLAENPNAIGEDSLKNMIKLETLRVDRTSIRTFEFLENLSKVDEIDFTGNNITSLDGIEKAIYLKYLNLDFNYITDLSPLSNLELYELNISRNCITNFISLENIWKIYGDSLEEQRETCDIPED